tara:strand:+ start:91 stop:315 length:225 start_codon:yes stop_codon:yes gene_type:complete
MTYSKKQFEIIKDRYAQIIIEGMSSKDILLYVHESLVESLDEWDIEEMQSDFIDTYGTMQWNNMVRDIDEDGDE